MRFLDFNASRLNLFIIELYISIIKLPCASDTVLTTFTSCERKSSNLTGTVMLLVNTGRIQVL